jgi:hypothetical protein
MMKRLVIWIILLIFAACTSSKSVTSNKLTQEQYEEVKANGGFNPYYVSPKKGKVWMPRRPKR